jgi:ferrous iron transport protein A
MSLRLYGYLLSIYLLLVFFSQCVDNNDYHLHLEGMAMLLSELTVGAKARIKCFVEGDKSYRYKLLSLGLLRGTEVLLERKAPLGDPLQIQVRGFSLSLRKDEAKMICVEMVL